MPLKIGDVVRGISADVDGLIMEVVGFKEYPPIAPLFKVLDCTGGKFYNNSGMWDSFKTCEGCTGEINSRGALDWTPFVKVISYTPLNTAAKVRQRCGRGARITSDNGDQDRPIRALITMYDGSQTELSYTKYGKFYGNYELPVDLVEDK